LQVLFAEINKPNFPEEANVINIPTGQYC